MSTTTGLNIQIIASVSPELLEALVYGVELAECELYPCTNKVSEFDLVLRIDNRDGAEVRCCQNCADHGDVSYPED